MSRPALLFAVAGCAGAYGTAHIVSSLRKRPIQRRNGQLSHAHTTMMGIIATNVAVFGAWHVSSWTHMMQRFFVVSARSHPVAMLLSIFSHRTPAHLAFNMFALWSLGPMLYGPLGGTPEKFIAHYVSCGLAGSLGSIAWHEHLLRRLAIQRYTGHGMRSTAAALPSGSLGASGAVFGVLAGCAQTRPEMRISLIFVPLLSLPVKSALAASMACDAAGLALGWRTFDHAAHLSGATAGYFLAQWNKPKVYRQGRL